ncbi:type 1 glutamine amidotransferase domain-containing protein [Plantactinospora sp. KBS50]|uniref:type 1 glutamine amidotransferase domain-containing protein n=1 Tax=Plantactinospora sp. KBS50 TaxID=2024580 RepID=UPI003518E21F
MVETPELVEPWNALRAAGADLELVSDKGGTIRLFKHYDKADTFPVDKQVDAASAADYAALLLPGGVGNPDAMRMNPAAVQFVRDFFDAGKPVAAICHALWLLAEAGVAGGRTMTSWPSLRTDLINAGATWADEPVVVDDNLVTSRKPDDIAAFNPKVIDLFAARAR